jgi:hypothetical protein
MVNWSSFGCGIVTPLAGALGGMGGAREGKAGLLVVVLFTLGGLLIGIGVGVYSLGLANSALKSKRPAAPVAYMIVPMLSFLVAMFVSFWVALWLVRFFP